MAQEDLSNHDEIGIHNKKDHVPNHLINESSPYLQQHVYNLVDWYPWGEEAFEKARKEEKLIFLSIGYSTCHWCHVMTHESFEDPDTSQYLNENFISIKLDREERPDIDQLYQSVLQVMGGNGGWPLSIFMTPQKEPIYAGTYFPVKPRYGMMAFKDLLKRIVEFYASHKDAITSSSRQLFEVLRKTSAKKTSSGDFQDPGEEDLRQVVSKLLLSFDEINGGFHDAPKFPDWPVLLFLIHQLAENKKEFIGASGNNADFAQLKVLLTLTLDNMASGGIYDHIGGGFHRYSVDNQWLVPHFEKMLYDNALALQVYSEAYKIFHKPRYLEVVKEIIEWLKREMLAPQGVFYSAMDADSEGIEGKYYVWKKADLDAVLISMRDGTKESLFQFYGVTEGGNFENGNNILHQVKDLEELGVKNNISIDSLRKRIEEAKKILLVTRNKRIPPSTDTKVLTSWNSLLIHGLYSASMVLDDPLIKTMAHTALGFIVSRLYDPEGQKLYTVYDLKTETRKHNANLDDYSYLIKALFDDFLHFPNKDTIELIQDLIKITYKHFWDENDGGYFSSNDLNTDVSVRLKSGADMPLPNGNAVMLENLLQLYYYTVDQSLQDIIEKIISVFIDSAIAYPTGYGAFLQALQWYIYGSNDIAVACEEDSPRCALTSKEEHTIHHDILHSYFIPRLHLQLGSMKAIGLPAFIDKKSIDENTTYYICHNFHCSSPENDIIKYIHTIDQLFIN